MDGRERWNSAAAQGRGGEESRAVLAVLQGCNKLIFILVLGFGEGRLAAVTDLREDSQYFASVKVRNSRKPWINSFRTEKGEDSRKTDPKTSCP